MANDNWQGRSHGEIVSLLSALKSDAAHEESQRWDNISTAVADSIDTAMGARTKLLDNTIWDGEAAGAAYDRVDSFYKEAASPQTGLAAEAGKIAQAASQDGETLIAASRVAQNYPEPGPGAPTNRKKEELEAIRAEAQRMYTDPLTAANRPEITDGTGQQQMGQIPQSGGGGNGGGGNGGGGSGSGTQTPSSSDGLANKDTKPQLAGGDGQQAGAGQGQGQGSGSGGGQGAGSGSGGGQGAGSGGSGSGLGSGSGGSGLPIGSTTAAGFSPSSTGTGVGGSGSGVGGPGGLSALRGGASLPGGAAAGAGGGGVNPAGVGAAGVRGMGPMGMMGGGAHGGHGKGEDDDDHAIPSYLINVDNGNELFGQSIKASPGVIGDWTENEEAEKKAREAEIRRYKSMGWNVKFE
ncbi:Uncharacterised protein [Mycobacteroides abscessus subsp. massiliense]|uniref:PPE family protein n=1 Tax=Mycobacteroides abscessus TaxID=36809 RepID=A0ABD7HIW2_9MYCO|nr:hypothetical protein [Mycobacteroides abscessus]RIT32697.1 hypothetical protein D2E76_23075 [Mycobacteroides abscessus]SKD36912.1 Uncharacterised protein [Mycobacteroides abscessus subsp. massiliense]SKD37100.1 Uncharacterised protein [Mycobacteroides abscessus subsp. massiliense]SKD46664.1 Uncharacterised protein [Mycobacteroides abscessus subsp. massiliense]SKD49129.1 Uncharacterised protein [Mycobacteroides abscessus subsp. massiliense]